MKTYFFNILIIGLIAALNSCQKAKAHSAPEMWNSPVKCISLLGNDGYYNEPITIGWLCIRGETECALNREGGVWCKQK